MRLSYGILPLILACLCVTANAQSTTTATSAPALAPDDGQWTMPAKNYQHTRFSGLDQINASNVKDLKVAWTFTTGVTRGHEAAPLVVGDTMYVVTPYPNTLYALDLKNSGQQKWKYEPKPVAAAQGVACCDVVNRGCFFDNGRIYYNTLDANVCCVDASNGKEIWKTQVGDINKGETMTMAPLVAKGKVYVGNSGGEMGVRGWLKCLDGAKGNVLWTAYSSGPDTDCLIGEKFKPFYDADKGKDLGVKTWPADHWQLGGGTVWGWISFDPALNLVYYGMSNPGCWNAEMRPGDNKWSSGVFARDADTGQAVWYYQYNPHDLWDHDEVNEHVILDLPIDGQQRKVVVHPARNGYIYVIDRTRGEVLSATPYVRITASHGVDLKTGRLIENKEKEPKTGKIVRDVQPASPGAKDWQPSAWSPRTNLLYLPHQNLSCDFEAMDTGYIAGTPFVGAQEKMYAGAEDPEHRGYFTAWDVINKKQVWRKKEKFPVWSGTVATAGDVVFYGTMEGWFKALDAKSGDELWKFKCGSGIIGQPITYKGPDGKQYVAILSGVGGWAGAIVAGDLDPRDGTAALGFVNAMKDLPQHTTKGGTLYVFSLP
ncbi:MAG: lanthanide-dependent methanol dehydrogenase [Phycisphaerales bacterium]|jgi:alcohol dehydrogenase (cytochrome c)|nr:lanthanide-dependent methanol dehydrogenase [Phycisphaerales bacterium]